MIIKSRCIVLHRFPYSDSSWIAKALTEECGVVSFIIKGGKRKESPFRGALDPLSLSEVVFNQNPQKSSGTGSDLTFIKEATLLNWHGNLRADLLNQATAQVMAEIVMRYAPQGIPLQDEFQLLQQALQDLDAVQATSTQPQAGKSDATDGIQADSGIFARWLLDTCDLWGYHLDLDSCSRCERALTEPAADFHPESGGLICRSCLGVDNPRARRETLLGLWQLRGGSVQSKVLGPTAGLAGGLSGREFVENALLAYLRNHIGFLKEIHSLQYLQEIRKLCLVQST